VLVVGGVLVTHRFGDPEYPRWFAVELAQPTLKMKIGGVVLTLAGVGLAVVALVYLVGSGQFCRNITSPLGALSRAQRRYLRSQVMHNVIEPGTDPSAVQLMATMMAEQLWAIWYVAGVTSLVTGEALADPLAENVVTAAVVASLVGAATVLRVRHVTRARRFLQDHAPDVDTKDEFD
jgi:hypothetical protein